MRISFALGICLLCINAAFGQRAGDIEIKYGKPIDVYSVSEHIWMTPEYATDGQVCRMRLYPKRIAVNINYISPELPFDELRNTLNRLVPVNQRGAKKQSFGVTATGGPSAWTTYAYDSVTFTFVSSFAPAKFADSPPLRKGDYVFPVQGNATKGSASLALSSDDFKISQPSATQIVIVKWNGRKCVGP